MAARATRSSRGLAALPTSNTPATPDQNRPVRPLAASPYILQHDRVENGRVTKNRPPPSLTSLTSPRHSGSRTRRNNSKTKPTVRLQAHASPQQRPSKRIIPNPRMGQPLARLPREVLVESPTNPRQIMIAGRLEDNPLYEPLPLTEHLFMHSPMALTVIDSPAAAKAVSDKITAMMSTVVEGDVIMVENEEEGAALSDTNEQVTADTLLTRPKLWSLPTITEQGKQAFLAMIALKSTGRP